VSVVLYYIHETQCALLLMVREDVQSKANIVLWFTGIQPPTIYGEETS